MIHARSRVILKPTSAAPHMLRAAIAKLGNVVGDVRIVSSTGDCLVLLPAGVTIPDTSRLHRDGQHVLWIHKSHLQPAD